MYTYIQYSLYSISMIIEIPMCVYTHAYVYIYIVVLILSYITLYYIKLYYIIQCEAPKIAKLVYSSNNYGLWYL